MYRQNDSELLPALKLITIVFFLLLTINSVSSADDSKLFVENAMQNKIKEIEQLIKDGVDVNSKDDDGNTGLHWAASFGLVEMANLLLSNGADTNLRNKDGNTPLHWAAGEGNTEVVKILISNGANVNAKGKSNWTPLRWAEARKRQEIADILKAAGAKP